MRYFLRIPVKITVQVLPAGCQLSYRKFYGFFLQCRALPARTIAPLRNAFQVISVVDMKFVFDLPSVVCDVAR